MSDAIRYTADVVWMKFVALNPLKQLKLDIKFRGGYKINSFVLIGYEQLLLIIFHSFVIPQIAKNCLKE